MKGNIFSSLDGSGKLFLSKQLGSSSLSFLLLAKLAEMAKRNPIGVSNRVEENQKSTLRFTTLNEGRGEFVENLEEKVSFSYTKYETFLE